MSQPYFKDFERDARYTAEAQPGRRYSIIVGTHFIYSDDTRDLYDRYVVARRERAKRLRTQKRS